MASKNVTFDSVPEIMTDGVMHRRILAAAINRQGQGKLNVTLDVTLQQGATSTTITDPRIGSSSVLLLSPKTSNAAYATWLVWVSDTQSGQAVLSHPANMGSNCTFRLAIIG